jgi:hypothetical protein
MKRSFILFPLFPAIVFLSIPNFQLAGIDWPVVGAWALNFLRNFIIFLIIGVLALWLIPRAFDSWSENVRKSPFKSFGLGIVSLFAGYAGILVLFFLVLAVGIAFYVGSFGNLGWIVLSIGLPAVGLTFGILNLFVAYVSKLVVALLVGKAIFESLAPKANAHKIFPLLLGLVIYLLVRAVPFLGWAVGVVVTLIGLGAIWIGLTTGGGRKETVVVESISEEAQADSSTTTHPNEDVEFPVQANGEVLKAAHENLAVKPKVIQSPSQQETQNTSDVEANTQSGG